MQLTYHCITKPDEWEIRVTEAGDAVRLPKRAKDYRTRDRERAVEWMTECILDEGECNVVLADLEAYEMVEEAELELAQELWKKAGKKKREAWCEAVDVDAPASTEELEFMPLLVDEMLNLDV